MFSILVAQPLELQIPVLLFRLVLVREVELEVETNFVEHPFLFLIHFAIFEEDML
jgi:hypothetical protein